ncbi:GIY-YIG nuclease family protein [Candidatus Berkelbacteria bacterium]|nr:GIY-YIG nuclease family protein [Candidatus Berkelbacteria bacterium]
MISKKSAEYFIYILRCGDASLYTGWTNDVEKRLAQHNAGKGSKYTRSRLPVALVYREKFVPKQQALARERHIKTLSHQQKIDLFSSQS